MSLADEIRNEIENIKELKITVGDINNHLSVLEGLTRKDIEEREKEAYQRGFEDGKKSVSEPDRIEVGDEVIYNGTTKCLVIVPETDKRYASLLDCKGIHYSADHRECKKTGKHYDIASILEAMRE